jgi:hypothetical protein
MEDLRARSRFCKWNFPSLSPERLCHKRKRRGEAVGFQSFRMRVFMMMGEHQLNRIELFHTFGTPESGRLKVTALNLFHPTVSPLFPGNRFFHISTQPLRKRVRVTVTGIRG